MSEAGHKHGACTSVSWSQTSTPLREHSHPTWLRQGVKAQTRLMDRTNCELSRGWASAIRAG